jgi:ferredoxin-NADP reductase
MTRGAHHIGLTVPHLAATRRFFLLSAGVGITPMIAMLEQLVRDTDTCGARRQIWFIHGARNGAEHAFADRVRTLAADCEALRTHIVYSAPRATDVRGRDYDSAGRIDIELLRSVLSFDDYEFYLCGPMAFLQNIHAGLIGLNVADDRIHYEFFGPAARLGRSTRSGTTESPTGAPSEPVAVRFAASDIETTWEPARGTLLDLAEAAGLTPAYSCRAGVCQTCATRVVSGTVSYAAPPMSPPPDGEALICCAVPRAAGDDTPLVLDL